ncbi:DJ-1/PfpI family protein [Streptococcus sp. 121]|uniref:DJ-1 family glyoxalase III n=1 Tax=Streptococcus sp. 121 TaxID=2797637 RepID=UPI0018F0656A|nr:DJ-1 family glyoxalase III [Streptococcus sp. 121]MBJ6745509.1 DJ-1/PfpI family protein [Streptococcus sp. 121]
MKKIAVLFADGFEEIEALTVVDVLRRAEFDCQMVGLQTQMTGSHGITVQMDQVWSPGLPLFDLVVLPGGMPGAKNLRDHDELMAWVAQTEAQGNLVAAICAAPIALERAGLLEDRNYTSYDGFDQEIQAGHYQKETVVQDGRVITSRGPASALAFSYALVDALGGDSQDLRKAMLYTDLFEEKM